MSSNSLRLRIRNLDISYNIDLFRPVTARDRFVQWFSNPRSLFASTRFRHSVLEEVNLDCSDGERVAVVGVNGAGKTSLCRSIAGGYIPQRGSIEARGRVHAIFDAAMGVVPELTGRENAELLIELFFPEVARPEKKKMVEEALQFSELGRFVDSPFQSYSKGMQARLCLSLVSVRGSDVLILDEVFDGADQFFKDKVSRRFLNMIEHSGVVIFVSHSADLVRKVCNRLILLGDKRIIFDGDVEEGLTIYNEVCNPYSSTQLGGKNCEK